MAESSRLERRPGLHTNDDVLFMYFLVNIRGRYLLENGNEKSLLQNLRNDFLSLIRPKLT